jgi:hypothetical protein
MPSEPLKRGKGETFLSGCNGKGVPPYVRGDRTVDACAVGNALENALHGAGCHADGSCIAQGPSMRGRRRSVGHISR